MQVPFILIVVLAIIVLLLFFRVIRGALRIVFSLLGIVCFVLALLSVIVFFDGRKLNEALDQGEKVVLYSDGEQLLAGVSRGSGELFYKPGGGLPTGLIVLGKSSLNEYAPLLEKGKTDTLDGLVIMVNESLVRSLNSTVEVVGVQWSGEEIANVLESDEPKMLVMEKVLAQMNLTGEVNVSVEALGDLGDDEVKAGLLLVTLGQLVEEQQTIDILRALKHEELVLFPEFFSIKVLKAVPDRLSVNGVRRSLVQVKEVIS